MTVDIDRSGYSSSSRPPLSPGTIGQTACILEVTARKPGNVHRYADLPGLHLVDFLLSATAIAEPINRASTTGVGPTVLAAITATRRVVDTNTNLGIVLLLAPLAAVADDVNLAKGVEDILAATTVDDARAVYCAIRLAQPGGLGEVPDHDVAREPTITLRAAMAAAAGRDSIARQYVNGFQQVLGEGLSALRRSLDRSLPLETAIIATYLRLLADYPDSLIARKYGLERAIEVSRRAADLVTAGCPEHENARCWLDEFDVWLRQPANRFNPGTTADLVTAALYAALRDGTVSFPLTLSFAG